MMESAKAKRHSPAKPSLFSFMLVFTAWLAPLIQKYGLTAWSLYQRIDIRIWWRWLLRHWHHVAAWWITVGIGLTALFLFAALVTWQNPQAMFYRILGWSLGAFSAGGRVAGWGALVTFIVSLPLTLPALIMAVVLSLMLLIGFIMLAPAWLFGGMSFSALLAVATVKHSARLAINFILKSIKKDDVRQGLVKGVQVALGLYGANLTTDGNARYMEGREFQDFTAANEASKKGARIFMGFVNNEAFYYYTEKHVYITASSRSGKGRDLIIPNLRTMHESVFVLDPKGENCNATSKQRQQGGHHLAVFDPYGLTSQPCASFNPLALLDKDDMVTGADYIAESLVIGKGDHWTESAKGLIRALVLHIATAPADQLGQRSRDLVTLRELLTGYLDITLEEMRNNQSLDGMVARLGESFIGIPDNEKGSIVSTARTATNWLDNPKLAKLFMAGQNNAINFNDFRDERRKISAYVCLPAMVFTTYPQVCRLLTTFALDSMMRSLTGRKRPMVFILDELAQLNHLPIVERAFTLGAGFGVQIWAIFQSVAQAKNLYSIDSIYGSSGVRCFFKIEDPDSCQFVSAASSGLFSSADVRFLPEYAMITLLEGANPLIVERLGARLKKN